MLRFRRNLDYIFKNLVITLFSVFLLVLSGGITHAQSANCDISTYQFDGDLTVRPDTLTSKDNLVANINPVFSGGVPPECKNVSARISFIFTDENGNVLLDRGVNYAYSGDQFGYSGGAVVPYSQLAKNLTSPLIVNVDAYISGTGPSAQTQHLTPQVTVTVVPVSPAPGTPPGGGTATPPSNTPPTTGTPPANTPPTTTTTTGTPGAALSDECTKEGFVINENGLCVPPNPFANGTGLASSKSLGDVISKVLKVLLTLAGLVAVLFLVLGGFWFLTAGGSVELAKKGKATITNALIGLVIIILSYTIVNVLTNQLTK